MKQKLLNSIRLRAMMLVAVMCAAFAGQAWGQAAVSTVLWSEDFSGYANNADPSGSITNSHTGTTVYGGVTLTYSKANGGTTTQTYTSGGPNGNSNLLISKNKGSFSVSGISTGGASELTISYATSGKGSISVSSSTKDVSISGSTVTTNGASTLELTFKNTDASNNVRIDDISVVVKTAAAGVTSLSIKTAPTKVRYEVGETLDMSGFVLDADGNDVTSGYTMTMGGAAIANGATLSSAGKKTITVAYGGKEVSQNISVGAVTSIAVTTAPTKTSYDTGDSFDPTGMVVTASLSTGELSEPDTWTKPVTGYTYSPDGALASSDNEVTITYATKNTTQGITVTDVAVTGVSVKASTTIEKTKTETLTPTFTPSNATNKNVTWKSDNTDVATVSAAGIVTAVAAGTATITVTTADGGKTASCVVTVVNKKGGIDAPYSVAEVEGQESATEFGNNIYVTGYIVGCVKDNKCYKTTADKLVNTNLLLADTPDISFTEGAAVASNSDGLIPVELPSGTIRTNWGPASNAVIGYKVVLKGNAQSYFSTNAIKGTSEVSAVSVAVSVGAAGYTTITTKYPVSFDGTDVTAYKATAINPTTIHLEAIDEAPAGEALVIKASAGLHTDITVIPSAEEINDNLLESSNGSVTGNGTIYALGKKNDVVGFYLVGDDVAIPAGKAYLEVAAPGPGVKGFTFNFDDATAIAKIQDSGSKIQDSEIFNLAGQKMSKLQKGVNIVNGKKVLVK